MLWLAACLPDFPLEVLSRGVAEELPLAVTDGPGARQRLLVCNGAARTRGLRPGMGLQAACALVPELRALGRDEAAEGAALANLAAWAGQFTPLVSLEPGRGLLLEIGGSLGLFGGLDGLWGRVEEGIARLGYTACLASAPTPLAAWLPACCGQTQRIGDRGELAERLASLPLACMELAETDLEALQGMGLRCLGDLLRLPRNALARRLGPRLLERLDRILGERQDPRVPYRPPSRFEGRLALPAAVVDAGALLFPLHRLLLELAGYLTATGNGVQRLDLAFLHPAHPPTRFALGLTVSTRNPQHLLELVRQRLERTVLPAPAEEVQLRAQELLPLSSLNLDLFARSPCPDEGWERLADRLSARLGPGAVQGVCPVADHRPEQAWRYARPGDRGVGGGRGQRPLWLLESPQPLETVAGRPRLGGLLDLKQGPERIESGWWDGRDVVRDYFVAESPRGEWLWVFRERSEGGRWFVHGVFG